MGQVCDQVEPPNEETRKCIVGLKIVMFLQFLISLNNIVCGGVTGYFFREGILGLFFMLFICCAYTKLQNSTLKWLVFFSIFFAVIFLVQVFTPVQQTVKFSQLNQKGMYKFVTAIISSAYYIAVSIYYFYPYRQFKSYEFSQNPNLRIDQNNDDNPNNNRVETQVNPAYDVQYGQIKQNQKNENTKGKTFQVFKGEGIRIG